MLLIEKIYIFTGLLMLIGVYLTIKYTPRCIITTTEMTLLRKKILNENIHKNEQQTLDHYETNGFRYNIGNFILLISILLHILSFLKIQDDHISVIYYLAIVCAIPMYVTRMGYRTNCFNTMFYPISLVQTSNETTLNGINLYLKHSRDEELDEDELKAYKKYKYAVNEVIILRHATNFGVILLLILDIFHGLLNIFVHTLTG